MGMILAEHTLGIGRKSRQNLFKITCIVLAVVLWTSMISFSKAYPVQHAWTVDDDGQADFHRIQDAINSPTVSDGDVIYVHNGTYNEQLVINKSINLVGEDPRGTIIKGFENGALILITANNTGISGFALVRGGDGLKIENCHNHNISANIIRENNVGLWIYNSNGNVFSGNNVTSNNDGFVIESSNSSIFSENYLENYGRGILMYSSFNNTIIGNSVVNSSAYAIYLEDCRNNTLIDNSVNQACEGIHLQRSHNNSIISNKVMHTGPYGLTIEYSNENRVQDCIMTENELTFQLFRSNSNLVSWNNISQNKFGMLLISSANNTLDHNDLTGNWWSFGVYGENLSHFVNDVGLSNLVDRRPIYYWVNRHDLDVPSSASYVAIVNSTNIHVENLNLTRNYQGILLAYSNLTTLRGLQITSNFIGLSFFSSYDNVVTECNVKDNESGMRLNQSNRNRIFGNNFIGQYLTDVTGTANSWDNGYPYGGNYWSPYSSIDASSGPNQNASGSDGIGDLTFALGGSNRDRYPLIAPANFFVLGVFSANSQVSIVSDCIISSFHFDVEEGPMLRFNISRPNTGAGIYRLTIPKQVLWAENDTWKVLLDGHNAEYSLMQDDDYAFLYFVSSSQSGVVEIWGTDQVSEFPVMLAVIILSMLSTLLAGFLARRRHFCGSSAKPQS